MTSLPALLLTVVLTGLVLWQLVTGNALGRDWRPCANRKDKPGIYWLIVLSQSAILIFVLVTGKTSLDFKWGQNDQGHGQSAVEVSSRAKERRDQAFDLHRAQKWAEAIAVFDELIAEPEGDAELRYWRGMAHWKLDHADQALIDFRRVIELEPANFEAHRSADRILSRQQRWDEVLELWDGYIGRVPTNAEAYFERGGTNFHKGNVAAAQADAAKACELGKSEACSLAERLKSNL